MSLRKVIHDAVEAQIKTTGGFEWIDVWKAQVGSKDAKELQYPFPFPAAFISTKRIAWQDMTLDAKEGSVEIDIFLFFERMGDTYTDAPDKDTSFADIDLMETLADNLHWIEDAPFKELSQIAEEDLTERYERPAFRLTFQTTVYKKVNQ